MSKIILSAAAAVILASCTPPPPVPPPRFQPNPPYPPVPVDPYTEPADPYGQNHDVSPPPAPEAPARPGEYPTARKTANPDQVISPYEPYNVIDVAGFRAGQLARDPSNKKIFRVP
jgi:hypothetical protein